MKKPRWHHALFAATLAVACGSAAIAQDAVSYVDIQAQRYNDVLVVNGGATTEEADAIKGMARQYPLRVVFSDREGDYDVADTLTVLRQGQVMAEVPDAGPWLLMDLPPGNYTLQANFRGVLVNRNVSITRSGTILHWVLPASMH